MDTPACYKAIIISFSKKVNSHFGGIDGNAFVINCQGSLPQVPEKIFRDLSELQESEVGAAGFGLRTRTRWSPTILVIFWASK